MTRKLYQEIASAVDAWKRCKDTGNDYAANWDERLDWLEKNVLPSGSGIDCGTKLDRERTTRDKIVLTFEYHHMDENGMYCGWTSHTVTVTPSFSGFDMKISGRDRNRFKDYVYDVYSVALSEDVEPQADNTYRLPVRERLYAEYKARIAAETTAN